MQDISDLLKQLKSQIKQVENGNFDQLVLKDIEKNYLDLMELIKLFLISERDSYYGYFMLNMVYQCTFNEKIIAGIVLNSFPPTFLANPLILCKYKLKEIIYIVCHEIEHIILNHPSEMIKSNPEKNDDIFEKFNYAADASVNDRINYDIKNEKIKYMNQPDGLINSDVFADIFKIKNIYHLQDYLYYFNLIKDSKTEKQNNGNSNSDQSSEPSDDQGVVTANSNKKLRDHDWGLSDQEEAEATVKEFVNSTVETMSEETRGLISSDFFTRVELLNKPPVISWQNLLKRYIGTISANKRKTRTRLNRRQPERFDLSGRVDEKILKIVVAIDTSGSVTDEDISKILNEILNIVSKRKHEITIIECDSEIKRIYKVRKASDIQDKVSGRGGTSFIPVIEYINSNKYYRDALLIYFTDGYGDYKIPKPKTYRNLWIVLEDEKNLSVKEPYGLVVKL